MHAANSNHEMENFLCTTCGARNPSSDLYHIFFLLVYVDPGLTRSDGIMHHLHFRNLCTIAFIIFSNIEKGRFSFFFFLFGKKIRASELKYVFSCALNERKFIH